MIPQLIPRLEPVTDSEASNEKNSAPPEGKYKYTTEQP